MVVADISFLAHCHFAEDNPVQTTDGDTIYELGDVLISVPSKADETFTVYKGDNYERNVIYEYYTIDFTFRENGTIGASVLYVWRNPSLSSGNGPVASNYTDSFTLSKVVDE